jgi:hypothetical protein
MPKISNRKLIVPEDPQAKPRESLPSYGRHVPLGSADGTDLPHCVSRFGVPYLRGHIRLLGSTSFTKLPFFPSRSPQRDPRPRGTERCYGAGGEDGNFVAYINRWSVAMPQPNDLSRSLVALDQDSTIIAVVELSQSSWLVGRRQ